jgi:DNA-binding MarR family transcriptional regulator
VRGAGCFAWRKVFLEGTLPHVTRPASPIDTPAAGEVETLIGHILRTRRRLGRALAVQHPHPLLDLHLTMPQLKVLVTLSMLGPSAGQELARSTGAALPTLTGIVDRLVAQGLVARVDDPRDRRVRRVELTEGGEALAQELTEAREAQHLRLLRRLDLPALHVVAQAFDLILDAAEPEDEAGFEGAAESN